jgi:hypothetical protein
MCPRQRTGVIVPWPRGKAGAAPSAETCLSAPCYTHREGEREKEREREREREGETFTDRQTTARPRPACPTTHNRAASLPFPLPTHHPSDHARWNRIGVARRTIMNRRHTCHTRTLCLACPSARQRLVHPLRLSSVIGSWSSRRLTPPPPCRTPWGHRRRPPPVTLRTA